MPSSIKIANFLESNDIAQALLEVQELQRDNRFDRYQNPFESKQFLLEKKPLPPVLQYTFKQLQTGTTIWWISHLLQVPIMTSDFRHYGGLFIYEHDDYLKPHVDAGMHPHLQLRKVATALLYLTPAELEFYTGDPATHSDPLLWSRSLNTYKPGDLLLFTNTDTAWHGVPLVKGLPRIALTVSYLVEPTDIPLIKNTRTRALFARTTWDGPDTDELAELRKKRASEEEHEAVYRL